MTAPDDREALAECDCGHPLWWHHETKGCMSNHHGGRLCWCQVHPDVLLARVKREAAVEAVRRFGESLGVNVGDDDSEWWSGYRQGQREALFKAVETADRIEGGDDATR